MGPVRLCLNALASVKMFYNLRTPDDSLSLGTPTLEVLCSIKWLSVTRICSWYTVYLNTSEWFLVTSFMWAV